MMKLSLEDKRMLEELCEQSGVESEKVLKLLEIESDYELKDRRTGIYDALKEILKQRPKSEA